jgi:hypothetical protein
MRFDKVPREARVCKVCNKAGAVEDVLHFMLECEHYAPIRAKHTNVFAHAHTRGSNDADISRKIFGHEHQLDLACCVHEMLQHRETILQNPQIVPKEREVLQGPKHVNGVDGEGGSGLMRIQNLDLPPGWIECYE